MGALGARITLTAASHGVRALGSWRESLSSREPYGISVAVADQEGRLMWPSQTVRLRPLGVGERLDAAIKIVRSNFVTLAKAALIIAIPGGIFVGLLSISVVSSEQNIFTAGAGGTTFQTGDLSRLIGGELLTSVIELVLGAFVIAVCFRVIGNAYLGQRAEWREALRFGWSRLHSVIWIALLAYLALFAGGIVIAVAIAIAAAIHIAGLTVLLEVVLGVGGFVTTVWFVVAVNLAVPIMMLEGVRGTKAIRRALSLTRGHWWSVFGTQLLAALLVSVAAIAVSLMLNAIISIFHRATVAVFFDALLLQSFYFVVLAPFFAAILVVLTIDLRVRKEGFDIQLLSTQMGVPPSASAFSFARTPPGAYGPKGCPPPGYPPPGYPPTGYGYPLPPGYPPASYPPAPPQPPAYPPPTYPPPGYPQAPSYPQPSEYPPPAYPQAPSDPPPAPPPTPGSPPAPGWPRPSDSTRAPGYPPPPPPLPAAQRDPGWPRPSDLPPRGTARVTPEGPKSADDNEPEDPSARDAPGPK
jgi:hypothetical protein